MIETFFQNKMLLGFLFLDPLKLIPALKTFAHMETTSLHVMKPEIDAGKPFLHLILLATEPNLQGKGCGTTLLKKICAMADEKHIPCFLRTANPTAKKMYEKFGFVEKLCYQCQPNSPFLWTMKREPTN